MKTCPTCKETKPLSAYTKNRNAPDGVQVYCGDCYRAYMRAYKRKRLQDPEYRAWYNSQTLAAQHEVYKDPERRARKNAFNRACKQRMVANDEVRLALNARKREWKADKLKDPDFLARHRAAYSAAHRHVRRATPPWADKAKILSIYLESVKRRQAGEDVQVDHIIPLRGKTVSGLHVESNLRIIPAVDNLQKLNKFLEELVYVVAGS